jgi:hypothetical protein
MFAKYDFAVLTAFVVTKDRGIESTGGSSYNVTNDLRRRCSWCVQTVRSCSIPAYLFTRPNDVTTHKTIIIFAVRTKIVTFAKILATGKLKTNYTMRRSNDIQEL